jgi:peroxiredoxin Q/BCP
MTTLEVGQAAPYFSGLDQDGRRRRLTQYKGKKLALFFYPKDNTPTCTVEVCNLRDNHKALKRAGYRILGVSADSQKRHQNFIEKHNLTFPLIADTDMKIINDYKVYGEKLMFGKWGMGIYRTTFIIDENGIIEHIFTQVKSKEHAEQILSVDSEQ